MGMYINIDGLPLQIGTDKTRVDLGGDYVLWGENREIETYINLGNTSFGTNAIQELSLPSSFSGTSTFNAAGIVSQGTMFPLQPIAPVTVANSSGLLTLNNPQLYIDQIDIEVLVAANAGSGGATGLTGIGLVCVNPTATPPAFVQVTPNAGVQFCGAMAIANMTAGKHWTSYADGTWFGSSNPPTAGSWLGAVPLVTNAFTPLPTHGYISAIASGGTFTGSSGGGLLKLRIRYNYYGTINQ